MPPPIVFGCGHSLSCCLLSNAFELAMYMHHHLLNSTESENATDKQTDRCSTALCPLPQGSLPQQRQKPNAISSRNHVLDHIPFAPQTDIRGNGCNALYISYSLTAQINSHQNSATTSQWNLNIVLTYTTSNLQQ